MQEIIKYRHSWQKIFSMCLCKGNPFLLHCEGISKVSLQTAECNTVVQLNDEPCMLTRFNLVPRVLSLLRESTLVKAGHVSKHANPSRTEGGSST